MSGSRNKVIVLLVVLVLGGALLYAEYGGGGIETRSAASASGPGFEVAIPKGFALVTDERMQALADQGLVTLALKQPRRSGFQPSIVIIPMNMQGQQIAYTAEGCQVLVPALEQQANATITKTEVPTLRFGPTCRYHVEDNAQHDRRAISTIVYSATRVWMVMCNFDKSDRLAQRACDRVVADFQFAD